MIAKLFSRRSKNSTSAPKVPDGRRFYAIGDIHGRLDLLDGLLEGIRRDEEARGGPAGELIFLGDLVDRGPHSAQVIDRLMALRKKRPATRFLQGNHEEVFLSAIRGDAKALRLFHRIGGAATVFSYGIAPEAYAAADYEELVEMLQSAVPDPHRAFLESFENMIIEGDYLFVHAGIRPGVALEEQRPSDLRWIRDDFLSSDVPLEKIVVHGHSMDEEVTELPHRIGLDTGAYRYGTLTAMGFEAGERWIVQERQQPEAEAA